MKILADECCDRDLVGALREEGYDVLYIPSAFFVCQSFQQGVEKGYLLNTRPGESEQVRIP